MRRCEKILVLIDERPESTLGVERAVALADREQAEITVLRVLDPLDDELAAWPVAEDREELQRELVRSETEWQLARLSPILGDRPVNLVTEWGKPCVAAIRRVADHGHDLLIKTARGRERGRRVFFGATAMHLFRKCPSPVWVVAPAPMERTPRVLAAIDPGHGDDRGRQALAARVLCHAEHMAKQLGAELHVIHAWDAPDHSQLRRSFDADRVERYVSAVGSTRQKDLRRALSVLSAPPLRTELVRGSAEEEITRYAAANRIDLIVMGSLGRSGIRGLLIGEMAEEILSRVDCGVLCIKPDGFKSPLSALAPRSAA